MPPALAAGTATASAKASRIRRTISHLRSAFLVMAANI